MPEPEVSLQPVLAGHEKSIERFLTEPEALGLDFSGFGNLKRHRARLRKDGYLGTRGGLLAVIADGQCVGEVSWNAVHYGGPAHAWRIGVGVLPEARGRGIARVAQLLLCRYLFEHTTAERIEAVVRIDNIAEQRALESAGFQRDGTLPRAQFKHGSWQDLALYSTVRADHP